MSLPPGTLVLARREISELMTTADWLAAVEAGFRAAAEGRAMAPPPLHLDGYGGAFHAKAASLQFDRRYAALKLNGNFPANPAERGLPTIQGALLLCDAGSGSLLAIMDSIEVTLRRTAAATALAAHHLARPDSETILICGCGAQAGPQVAALRNVLPLRRLMAWDQDLERAHDLARSLEGLDAEATSDLASAGRRSDVIVTCTTAIEPFLQPDFVRPGTFIAAVGADSPAKSEIAPQLMARALVVADSLDQCAAMGDLHHALRAGAMRRDDVHAELGGLVAGSKPGRTDGEQITLFDSTGTAIQDAAAAALIYQRALDRSGLRFVDLAA